MREFPCSVLATRKEAHGTHVHVTGLWGSTPCKVTPVILHGVVSPEYTQKGGGGRVAGRAAWASASGSTRSPRTRSGAGAALPPAVYAAASRSPLCGADSPIRLFDFWRILRLPPAASPRLPTEPPTLTTGPNRFFCLQIPGRKQTDSVYFIQGIFKAKIDQLVLPRGLVESM